MSDKDMKNVGSWWETMVNDAIIYDYLSEDEEEIEELIKDLHRMQDGQH